MTTTNLDATAVDTDATDEVQVNGSLTGARLTRVRRNFFA